jgi:hypothetical protein
MADEYASEKDATTRMSEREQKVYEDFCERLQASLRHSQEWREEARALFDMEAGRQWDPTDEAIMKEKNRPMVTLNLISKFIDAVTGLQINNRQEIRVYPRTMGVAQLSDVATGALSWAREQCDAEFEETDAGHDCLLTGMGWTEHFLNEEVDPAGTVDKERRDPLEMCWDPMARKKNLIDGRYVIRLKPCTLEEARELLGTDAVVSVGFAGVDEDLLENFSKALTREDYDADATRTAAEARGKALVADYQWFEKEDLYPVTVVLADGPQKRELTAEEWAKVEPELKAGNVSYQVDAKRRGRVYYRCWISGAGVHGGIRRLRQGAFLYQAITGKRDRNKNLSFGLGRNLVDPQKWVNKFFSSILWQLSVNPKGGLLAEEDAFEDVQQAKDSWADPSQITIVTPGALQNGKVEPKPNSNYPTGMDRLMTFSMEALPQVSGLNAELLGLTDRDQAGVVEAQRKQGALAIIAWYFDALHRHYKQSGRLTLAMIRDFVADDRLIRIAGKEGEQYVPLTRKALSSDFDLLVDEAPTSVNMRERVWLILQNILPIALQSGIRVPPEVLDYMPIPADLAQKWKQSLGAPPEQQQMEMQKFMAELREVIASARQKESAAALNEAKAQQTTAETPAKVAQLHAESVKTAGEAGAALAGE